MKQINVVDLICDPRLELKKKIAELDREQMICIWYLKNRSDSNFIQSTKRKIKKDGWNGLTEERRKEAVTYYNLVTFKR